MGEQLLARSEAGERLEWLGPDLGEERGGLLESLVDDRASRQDPLRLAQVADE
jgi:hypothetical protein